MSSVAQSRLLRDLIRRRLWERAAVEFQRSARQALSKGELDATKYDDRMRVLGNASTKRTRGTLEHLSHYALCSYGKWSPWRSGVSGLLLMSLLAAPVMIYELGTSVHLDMGTLEMANTVRHVLRWSVYGLLFGYFYPILRGRDPVQKAAAMASVIVVAEAVRIFVETAKPRQILASIGVQTAVTFTIILVFSLWWERRLVRSAGLSWVQVRDLRSVRSIGTPVTAIVVSAATAIATGIAAATVAAIFKSPPDQQVPDSQRTAPSTSTPSPR
jgi:hypothetical protein